MPSKSEINNSSQKMSLNTYMFEGIYEESQYVVTRSPDFFLLVVVCLMCFGYVFAVFDQF